MLNKILRNIIWANFARIWGGNFEESFHDILGKFWEKISKNFVIYFRVKIGFREVRSLMVTSLRPIETIFKNNSPRIFEKVF